MAVATADREPPGPVRLDPWPAQMLLGTKQQVAEFNHNRLRDLKRPVFVATASHEGIKASEALTEEAGSLHATIPLAIGCRIMLTENTWTERGLVNGSLGTLRDIVWRPGADWQKDPPFALLVQFDGYHGPCLGGDEHSPMVPIFRSRRDFYRGAATCSRTQFPVTNAYAITVHKAQGMTVEKAVLNLSSRDFVPGLSYVAVSRVKTLRGILFEESFDYERFQVQRNETVRSRDADRERRANQHISL